MKNNLLIISLWATAALTSQAATVLIGGNTLDGDFELSAVNDFQSPTAGGWVSTGDHGSVQVKSNQTVISGNNAVIGKGVSEGTLFFGRSTGHTIVIGDRFDGGFSWRDKAGWDISDGSVSMILFYTDTNAIDGTRTNIVTWDSGIEVTNDATETELFGLTTLGAADGGAGKTLFVSFEANEADAVTVGTFARVDGITLNLTAAAVPEPSSTALLGLGGLALILRRRK